MGQKAGAGRIVGHIDGVAVDAVAGPHVKGWACQQGRPESLIVHIYANESAKEAAKGIFALTGNADLDEEPAVDTACQDTTGRKHRFDIPIPGSTLLQVHGMPLFVHGIRAVGNVENAAISGSGTTKLPDAPPVRHEPASYPHLAGRYTSLDAHPRVFDTREDLRDIARRTGKQGTHSSGRYAALADRVRRDLSARVDWQATYSGCDLEIYL